MNKKNLPVSVLNVIICLFLLAGTGHANESTEVNEESARESHFSNFSVEGYIKNETAYRLHSPHRFSKVQNLFQLEAKNRINDRLDGYLLAWAMYDAAYDIYTDDYPNDVRDEYRSNFTADESFDQILREGYFDILFKSIDIRLGKQQVVWGEAIGLRITDIVNPQDYREFILDDFIDSRIPLWMAKLNYYFDTWTIEGLWILIFEPNRPALSGSEWEWTFNRINPAEGINATINDPEEPSKNLENGEFGGRISGLLADWNVAASYLYAWDDSPASHVNADPQAATLNVDRRFHRMHMIGFTFANAFGRFVPRGEFSYNLGKHFSTADQAQEDSLKEKNFLYYMMGTDYSVSDYYFNVQLVQKVIMDYETDIYEDEVQTNLSLWFQAKLYNETLKPEVLTIYGSNDKDWMIRPKIVYDFTDYFSMALGIDIFTGPAVSFFGQFNSNDRVYMELKYSF